MYSPHSCLHYEIVFSCVGCSTSHSCWTWCSRGHWCTRLCFYNWDTIPSPYSTEGLFALLQCSWWIFYFDLPHESINLMKQSIVCDIGALGLWSSSSRCFDSWSPCIFGEGIAYHLHVNQFMLHSSCYKYPSLC